MRPDYCISDLTRVIKKFLKFFFIYYEINYKCSNKRMKMVYTPLTPAQKEIIELLHAAPHNLGARNITRRLREAGHMVMSNFE